MNMDGKGLPAEFEAVQHEFYEMAFVDEKPTSTGRLNDISIYSELRSIKKHYADYHFHAFGGVKQLSKAKDLRTGRSIAMAELKKKGACSEEEIESFLREARITAMLEHPNIVPVYDMGINRQGKPFFTMKFMKDQSLKKVIRELVKANPKYTEKYTLNILLDIFIKVCEAVDYAHSVGIIHLDIKPANIMIGDYGEVYLCDWGIAKIIGSTINETYHSIDMDADAFNDITLSGVIKGTPGFMAPEQIDGKLAEKSQKTDIYALGAILYSILVLKQPLEGEPVKNILSKTLKGNIPEPISINFRKVPEPLNAVCVKAMSKKQNCRYESVSELIKDIRLFTEGFSTVAEHAGRVKSLMLLMKRNKLVSTIFLLLLSTVLVGSLVSVKLIKDNERALEQTFLDKKWKLEKGIEQRDKKLSKLEANEVALKKSILNESDKLKRILDSDLLKDTTPIVLKSKVSRDFIDKGKFSNTVFLVDNPQGSSDRGLMLTPDDVFYTGISLPRTFTVSFWINSDHPFLLTTHDSDINRIDLSLNKRGEAMLRSYPNDDNSFTRGLNYYNFSAWNYVTISFSGRGKGLRLYVNGKLEGEVATDYSKENWGQLRFKNVNGVIDELRVWNKPLTKEDIVSNMNSPSPLSDGQVAHFNFNQLVSRIYNVLGQPIQHTPLRRVLSSNKLTAGNALKMSLTDVFETGINLPGNFTLSVWLNVSNSTIFNIESQKYRDEGIHFGITQGQSTFFSLFPNDRNTVKSRNGAVKNGWNHFCITRNGYTNKLTLYVNGVLQANKKSDFSRNLWEKVRIYSSNAEIDELRLWNIPLDYLSISIDKDSKTPIHSGLIGWYKFDEEDGDTFIDSSSKGHDVPPAGK